MSRYRNLVGSKKKFIKEMLDLDRDHNFLNGAQYQIFCDILYEGRYKTEDSEWINKIINKNRDVIKWLKKGEVDETVQSIESILRKHSLNSGDYIPEYNFPALTQDILKLIEEKT